MHSCYKPRRCAKRSEGPMHGWIGLWTRHNITLYVVDYERWGATQVVKAMDLATLKTVAPMAHVRSLPRPQATSLADPLAIP